MSTAVGGAQVISTVNGGNVVSTEVPTLDFGGNDVGDLIRTITNVQPNMVSGVTLDNTFVGHKQFRFLPTQANENQMMWQFSTPNWCHVRDIAINLASIFRLGGVAGNRSQTKIGPITQTRDKVYNGLYHMTNGGILGVFKNMSIKMGGQTDIFTAFEKNKSARHILNSWLRGKWDQFTIFSLIDRWDAWYPSGLTRGLNGNYQVNIKNANQTNYQYFTNPQTPYQQSDNNYERRLSRVLADRALIAENSSDFGVNANRTFTQIIENISFPFHTLHSLFQQNIILPPGIQFIIEFEIPGYVNFSQNYTTVDGIVGAAPYVPNAKWYSFGYVMPMYEDPMWNDNFDDLTFQQVTAWPNKSVNYLVSIFWNSVFNSITMNCLDMKPEIARSLQDERIKRPLVYNYSQMVATTVGNFVPGQYVYNFTLPPNQAIPTQFLFAWVNPTMYLGPANSNTFPLQPNTSSYAPGSTTIGRNYTTDPWNYQAPLEGYNNANTKVFAGTDIDNEFGGFDGPNPFDTNINRQFLGTSFTPLPIPYKRMILRRGGFQEIYQYGTYYDGLGNNIYAFQMSEKRTFEPLKPSRQLVNAATLYGPKNITPDSTQKYFDHLEEYQWDKKSTNGLGPLERRMKYSYTQGWLSEGKWCAFQVNPAKQDIGQYPSDQNAYTIDVVLEMDLDSTNNIVNWTGLNAQSMLVCVRVLPAQLSLSADGTCRTYVWPNLLVSPDIVVSANPPPAGPGGAV